MTELKRNLEVTDQYINNKYTEENESILINFSAKTNKKPKPGDFTSEFY